MGVHTRLSHTHTLVVLLFVQDGSRSEEQKEETQVESYVAQRYIENPYLISGAGQLLPYLTNSEQLVALLLV